MPDCESLECLEAMVADEEKLLLEAVVNMVYSLIPDVIGASSLVSV